MPEEILKSCAAAASDSLQTVARGVEAIVDPLGDEST
jgi:hypothetical protein